ncbi:MAG: CpsD/CapB family tyrosine-protein kinase, partial [Actinobacteria bacterium]
SAEPNEGKSTIVSNLAVTLAQTGLRVVVVDGDLRLPTIHAIFNIPNTVGFGDVLKGSARLEDAIVKSWKIQGLSVLPSGGPFEHPAELLASTTTGPVLADLAQRFDVVLVDSPALLALADALSLATEIPDVLVVVGRSQTKKEALISVRKQLTGIGAHPLGIVVNRSEEVPSYPTTAVSCT